MTGRDTYLDGLLEEPIRHRPNRIASSTFDNGEHICPCFSISYLGTDLISYGNEFGSWVTEQC